MKEIVPQVMHNTDAVVAALSFVGQLERLKSMPLAHSAADPAAAAAHQLVCDPKQPPTLAERAKQAFAAHHLPIQKEPSLPVTTLYLECPGGWRCLLSAEQRHVRPPVCAVLAFRSHADMIQERHPARRMLHNANVNPDKCLVCPAPRRGGRRPIPPQQHACRGSCAWGSRHAAGVPSTCCSGAQPPAAAAAAAGVGVRAGGSGVRHPRAGGVPFWTSTVAQTSSSLPRTNRKVGSSCAANTQAYGEDFADFMHRGVTQRSSLHCYLDLFCYQAPASR